MKFTKVVKADDELNFYSPNERQDEVYHLMSVLEMALHKLDAINHSPKNIDIVTERVINKEAKKLSKQINDFIFYIEHNI